MRISGRTLDDVLYKVYKEINKKGDLSQASRGHNKYLNGVLLELQQPRARLSRTETRGKVFSALGELLWYLSRSDRLHMIEYYIKAYALESADGSSVYAAYGPRMFSYDGRINQIQNVIDLLQRKPATRRAVVQLYHPSDLERRGEQVACTCYLQFVVRANRLHMIANMRSNDAFLGLPHDVFCFTMLQEIVARSVGARLGIYRHFVGDLHIYRENFEKVEAYLSEDIQPTVLMPEMPEGDPWPSIRILLDAEEKIRNSLPLSQAVDTLSDYWLDLVRLLQAIASSGDEREIDKIKDNMVFKKYAPYIDTRKNLKRPIASQSGQMYLPL